MQTLKARLSQKIFEIPNGAREMFCNVELTKEIASVVCLLAASIYEQLEKEDENHPLTLFTNDRIEDLKSQLNSSDDTIIFSSDVDTITFLLFACEQEKDITPNINEASAILTGTLASILVYYSAQESL